MWAEQIAKIITAFVPLAWLSVAVFVIWLLRDPLRNLVGNLTNVEAFGVKLALSGSSAMNAAIELARKYHAPGTEAVEPSESDRRRALDRANKERTLLDRAEILWVDDHPSNNRNEARMLRSFGALITFACTTDEALHALLTGSEQNQPFYLILSDISRPPDLEAGLTMLPRLRIERYFQPVVFYVGQIKANAGTPAGAFGVAYRPDELLHLILDALARTRGTK